MRLRATRLSAISNAMRSAFKIASVNPVLWWDAESHRAALAGGAATLFQDSGGTSAVTAVEQPVGLLLDSRLQKGAEQLQNSGFDGTGEWLVPNASWGIQAGVASNNGSNQSYASISQPGVFAAGNSYSIEVSVNVQAGAVNIWIAGTQLVAAGVTGQGVKSYFVSAMTSGSFAIEAIPGAIVTVDNASVRQVHFHAAMQATSTARPVLKGGGASPLMLQFDGVDDGLASAPFIAGSLPANADAYLVFHPDADEQEGVLVEDASSSGSRYFGTRHPSQAIAQSADGTTTAGAAFTANGSLIAGTTNPTRAQLFAATQTGVPVLLQVTGLNLAAWTQIGLGRYTGNSTGYGYKGRHGCLLITHAQPDATRAKIRKALAKAYQITGVV